MADPNEPPIPHIEAHFPASSGILYQSKDARKIGSHRGNTKEKKTNHANSLKRQRKGRDVRSLTPQNVVKNLVESGEVVGNSMERAML
jgi:hypothetical protein